MLGQVLIDVALAPETADEIPRVKATLQLLWLLALLLWLPLLHHLGIGGHKFAKLKLY